MVIQCIQNLKEVTRKQKCLFSYPLCEVAKHDSHTLLLLKGMLLSCCVPF